MYHRLLDELENKEWGATRQARFIRDPDNVPYGVEETVISPERKEWHKIALLGRWNFRPQRGITWWSAGERAWKVANDANGWLFAYYNDLDRFYVFDPQKYDHTDFARGEKTYEFVFKEAVNLMEWLKDRLLRIRKPRVRQSTL